MLNATRRSLLALCLSALCLSVACGRIWYEPLGDSTESSVAESGKDASPRIDANALIDANSGSLDGSTPDDGAIPQADGSTATDDASAPQADATSSAGDSGSGTAESGTGTETGDSDVASPNTIPLEIGAGTLAMWFRADTGALNASGDLAADGEAVAEWTDLSGNVRHATQSDPAQRPNFRIGSGGLSTVSFAGTNPNVLCRLAGTYDINGLSQITLVAVTSDPNNTTSGTPWGVSRAALQWEQSASWGYVVLNPHPADVAWRFGTTEADNNPYWTRPDIGAAFGIYIVSKDNLQETLRVDGVQVATNTAGIGVLAGNEAEFGIAGGDDGIVYNFRGRISEIIVYAGVLTPNETIILETYLSARWRVSIP